MTNAEAVSKTNEFIRQKFSGESSGHDYWHMYRVWRLARHIAEREKDADMLVVELGALLHDIADWKFHDDEEAGPRAAREWLESLDVDEKVIKHIEDIIRNVSFKGAKVKSKLSTKEGQIIHDADKLDAMGAIGIARAFAYGGMKNRPMHEPDVKPEAHETIVAYKNSQGTAINHFHEKLLLLKDWMFTETARQIAENRHEVLENFLNEFHAEWDGDK